MKRGFSGLLLGTIACAFIGGTITTAEAARYSKREVNVQATTRKHTAVKKRGAGRMQNQRRRPSLSSEAFRAQQQARVSHLTKRAIEVLWRLIRLKR